MKQAILLLGLTIFTSSQVQAYSLINSNWNYLGGSPITVDYTLNANCDDAVLELSEAMAASETWSSVDNTCMIYRYTGTNSDTSLDDLLHEPLDGNDIFFGGSDPTALAITQTWTYSGTDDTAEWNMQIFDNHVWDDSGSPGAGEYDLRSVILHELGHGLGLGHSEFPAAVMDPTLTDGTLERVLHWDDREGLIFIYDCTPQENCETIAYHQGQGTPTWYSAFPVTGTPDGDFTKTAYLIEPIAAGEIESMRLQLYNAQIGAPHDGTLRVAFHSDLAGNPDAMLAGPFDVNTDSFTAAQGFWDEIDLTPFAFAFDADVPFHVVWEFLPDLLGTDKLAILGTGAPVSVGSQMYNDTAGTWGWWWEASGDMLQEVVICYTEIPPGHIVLDHPFIDMGRIENGADLTSSFYAINDGGSMTAVNGVSVSHPAFFSAHLTPATLGPGDSALVQVTFNSGASTIFRDTTTVTVEWGDTPDTVEFFATAGSSRCDELTNSWIDDPDELQWFQTSYSDTTKKWGLFYGLNRDPAFMGHQFSDADTSANMLWTMVDNPSEDHLILTFAQTQAYPAWTDFHALYVGSIEQNVLTWDYLIDLSDSTSLVWDATWRHLTSLLPNLTDSVAIGFYYEGYDADSWYIDDVELCFTAANGCNPVHLTSIALGGGEVSVTWNPFPDAVIHVYVSEDAYDFSARTLMTSVGSAEGNAAFISTMGQGFYHAVVECEIPEVAHLPEYDLGTRKPHVYQHIEEATLIDGYPIQPNSEDSSPRPAHLRHVQR
jgi:hypothetical protein